MVLYKRIENFSNNWVDFNGNVFNEETKYFYETTRR